ncbi:MAG: hypothetical protein HDQ99_12345 [Lachnospiraceae bacterium]|nr:hypothetical protein [Lachnospiraceae bacterium]
MKKIIMVFCACMSTFLLGACAMGEDRAAAGGSQESYPNFSREEVGNMVTDESGQQNGQTDSSQQSVATGEENGEAVSSAPEVHVLMAGNVGDLGLGFLAYAEPEQEGEDYRLCFFATESGSEDLYKPLAELEFSLGDADYIFPDVRENNASIGRFMEVYYYDVTEVEGINDTDVIVMAKYEVDGKECYDMRVYRKCENGYSADEALIRKLNEKCSEIGEASIIEMFVTAMEETPLQPENESQSENTPEIVFFGSWQVMDYRTSRIYALSQEKIDEFLTYGMAYYEDAFFLNGIPVEAEGFGYVYMDYTKAEVEEGFNIDMTGWWNESDTITCVGITSVESDESPSLSYCFGTDFFVVDADTIWIYYEGVFFQAKRAGA